MAAVNTSVPDGRTRPPRPSARSRRARPSPVSALRWAVLIVIGGYLLLPLLAMAEFSTRGTATGRSLDAWREIGSNADLLGAITMSLELSALTVVATLILLVPTMTWVHLRVPRMRRLVEFACLLPLTIPAIVLVVGIGPIYLWVNYLLGDSPLTLTFVYVILVLPYAHRAIDGGLGSADIVTLAEAARSLGASWPRVLVNIVLPNIRGAVISASIISVALVLGEFTVASLLNFDTLQVVINLLGKRDAAVSVAVSAAALLFAFVLLYALAQVASRRPGTVAADATEEGPTP
ncbi:ABC transporter permease [Streptomyces rugosispiralis]|uniref:ABC transporter permease subunit n=1 Tax=Streptomyces rugosispiralis TaxID=2967341 RepID=A0ABT1UQM0_9ACTN|nr:ABC transporter permease subunit [Streptomyces rugosispiralis]MCQ8186885.1 ABC transporter permease subunit [Streptomyces rugosispiralis]